MRIGIAFSPTDDRDRIPEYARQRIEGSVARVRALAEVQARLAAA